MQRHRKYANPNQLEFAALVEAAENASREIAAQRRARRHWARDQRKAMCLLEAPWRSRNGFNEAWLASTTKRIKQCASLREGIVLTACRLAELLDMDIETGVHDPKWKGNYARFCVYRRSLHDDPSDKADAILRVFWEEVRDLFKTYDALNRMDAWSLFERVCSGEIDDLKATNSCAKEAILLENYSAIVSLMHMLVTDNSTHEDTEAEEKNEE